MEFPMYKHLLTAAVLLGLSLVGPTVGADVREQQRAQQHMNAYLGVRVDTTARGEDRSDGVAIWDVQPNGPADKAGLGKGDVITQVGRRIIEDFDDLSNAIIRHRPGDRVTLRVRRDGKERLVEVTLSEPPAGWSARSDEERDHDRTGGHVENEDGEQWLEQWLAQLENQLQEQTGNRRGRPGSERGKVYLGVETKQWTPSAKLLREGIAGGVEIMEVPPGSPAAEAGLRSGDVITAAHGSYILNPEHLYQVVQRAGSGREITLEVLRDQRPRKFRALLSAGGEDMQSLRRLARQVEQMEKRLALQDRYGIMPRMEDRQSLDLDEIQRQIRQLDKQLREMERNRKNSSSQDR
jgi:predicted metalloprotease with PDZ domain